MQKELRIRIRPQTSQYEVYFENGGEIPQILSGLYTSKSFAQRAINEYKSTKKPSVTKSTTPSKEIVDATSSGK